MALAQKKVIFFAIVGVIAFAVIVGIWLLSKNSKPSSNSSGVTIWINEGTTEDFQKLIDGFRSSSSENRKIPVTVEKKTSDTNKYRTLLLKTLADGTGPDVFMVHKGEDFVIEGQLEHIPNEVLNITDFENRFDDTFRDLVVNGDNTNKGSNFLLGIPLGYETLGVFYNRALMRTGVPKTWQELELLYRQFPTGKYPSNLGLSPQFVPNISNVLTVFFEKADVNTYKDLGNITSPFSDYYSYGDLMIGDSVGDTTYTQNDTLRRSEIEMKENQYTTFDQFMNGNIGMIIGYPSLVFELEKSKKRIGGSSIDDAILTGRLPVGSDNKRKNVAKYFYLGISKQTKNADASARFLEYLMTPEAQRILMEIYPHLIPAQKEFQGAAQGTSLSKEIRRAKIDTFIPQPGESTVVFDFGMKGKFQTILNINWYRFNNKTELSLLGSIIAKSIQCEIQIYNGGESGDCEQ